MKNNPFQRVGLLLGLVFFLAAAMGVAQEDEVTAVGGLMDGDGDEWVEPIAAPEPEPEPAIAVRQPPTAFPNVALVAGSQPRYAAFRLDPWGKNVLYLLFDGNRDEGYNRLYVWNPEGRQHASPTALAVGGEGRFPAVSLRETEDDEVTEAAYTFRSVRSVGMSGGGGGTHFNYLTGETTVRQAGPRRAVTNITFSFMLDYMRDRSPQGAANRLMLRIPSQLNTATNFVAARPVAPWNGISFNWSISPQSMADVEQAHIRFGGHPHYGNSRVTVQSMPDGFFDIELRVSPYMKSPVFTTTIPMLELARDGLVVEVPFGWYSAAWRANTHPWIGGAERSQSSGLMALGRSRPATTVGAASGIGGGGPAATLRGPPPSQLRGGPGSN